MNAPSTPPPQRKQPMPAPMRRLLIMLCVLGALLIAPRLLFSPPASLPAPPAHNPPAAPSAAPVAAPAPAPEASAVTPENPAAPTVAVTPPPAAPVAAPADLEIRVKALEQKLTQVDSAQASQQGLPQRIASVEQELAAAQAEIAKLQQLQDAVRRQAVRLSAYQRLSEALASGQPYRPALDALRAAVDGDKELAASLEPLEPYAEPGVPTPALLQQEFEEAYIHLLAPEPAADAPWYRKVTAGLSRLVVIRKTGTPAGEDMHAVLARAETDVSANNLIQALKEISTLEPAAAEAFEKWRAHAAARVEADAALAKLHTLAAMP